MNKNANRWKKIVYEYDLISGKVNKVMYQPRYSDQFTHRYFYDAENRLTEVQTSLDGFTWEREAKYEYYLHGPLARTVLGQQQVQGMDYAYTLQGWLKGVNSTGATATHDIGADGQLSSLNKYVARDALGFNLNYFHGDFQPINPGVSPFPAYRLPSKGLPDSVYRPLYNGNISSMATRIRKFDTLGHLPVLYNYKYDQLNRLAKQDAFFNFNAAANTYYNADSTRWKPDSTFNEQIRYDANGNIQHYKRYAIGPNSRMDDLSYKYYPGTNRLKQVNDVIPDNSYGTNPLNPVVDIDNQVDSNYIYDSIGNLIRDKAEKITNIQWNVYGKITEITKNALTSDRVTTTRTKYTYDAQGNRISKVFNYYHGQSSSYRQDYTWYVRDAQGNLLSTYTTTALDTSGNNLDSLMLKQADVQLYGSSRLGNLPPRNSVVDQAGNTGPWINPVYRGTTYYRGDRQYELTNHLGNVLTTISDRKIPVYSGSSLNLPGGFTVPIADYFEPDMVSATDYYPFGMVSRGIGPSDKYRFGFNGKENDNEVKGFAQQQDYGMRIYDPRVGRFLSVDPLTKDYPWYTPYQFAGNKPIWAVDLDGAEELPTNTGSVEGEKFDGRQTKTLNTPGGQAGCSDCLTKTEMVGDIWYYHKGGLSYGNNKKTAAGWYTSEQYVELFSKTEAASALADALGLYTGYGRSRNLLSEKTREKELQNFVGSGLNENTTKHLVAAAKIEADNDNFLATGTTYASGFNVEDILGVGFLFKQGAKFLSGVAFKGIANNGVPVLRAAYEAEVLALRSTVNEMTSTGLSSETIARTVHLLRRELGIKYKDLTPKDLLETIYNRNLKKYGDKLGPSIEYLRGQGKSWDDIIESAIRPGGKDINFNK